MDLSSEKPKKAPRPKKMFIGGMAYVPKMDGDKDFERFLQQHYNSWLGWDDNGEPLVKVTVTEIEYNREYRFDFHRSYGDWYTYTPSSYQDEFIFELDQQLILAEDYQTETEPEIMKMDGHKLAYSDIGYFAKRYLRVGEPHGVSPIDSIKYEQIDRDNISITIYLQ